MEAFGERPLVTELHLCFRVRTADLGRKMENKPKVCRRLRFDDVESTNAAAVEPSEGAPEGDNAHAHTMEEEMLRHLQAGKLRWNFDFLNDCPLSGRWQWEKVGPSEPPMAEN